MPFKYLDYLPPLPSVARPLKLATPPKCKDYLLLAQALLNRFPTQCMARAISFLMRVANNTDPGSLGDLIWFSSQRRADDVQIQNLATLSKVAPAMRFRARLRQ